MSSLTIGRTTAPTMRKVNNRYASKDRGYTRERLTTLQEMARTRSVRVVQRGATKPETGSGQVPLTNLSFQLSSFVGREREMAEVKGLLERARLLTLTGAGGCGKTRLALQVAGDLIANFSNGVWLVDLASVDDPALAPQAIASVFNLPETPKIPLIDVLRNYLRAKMLLLVLDNCEHLVEACAQLSLDLLRACPNLRIVATSREPLNIAGETCYRVPCLSTPEPEPFLLPERLMQFESIQLFMARAAAVDPHMKLTDSNAPAVTQICRRLDGLPLAIELAAARVRVLSAEQLAVHLDDRFQLLTGVSRSTVPRQRTLRAAIDWSYELLSPSEQILLRRLSAFAGGWSLEAAEVVCSGDGIDETSVLGLHSQLIDKSLVAIEERDGTRRYRLLETIRQYSRDRLLETGGDDALRDRHLDCFLRLAEEAEPKLRGPEQFQWLDRLEIDQDNVRAALEWSLGQGRIQKGLRLAGALRRFWEMRGFSSEVTERVNRLLSHPEAAARTQARANALLVAADTAYSLGAVQQSREYLEELVSIAGERGAEGRRTLVLGLAALSDRCLNTERDAADAEAKIEQAFAIARSLSDEWLIALAFYERGWLCLGWRDGAAALQAFEESQNRFRRLGDKHWSAVISSKIGRIHLAEGDYARARREAEVSLSLFLEAKCRHQVLEATILLGCIAQAEQDYDRARTLHAASLEMAREFGSKLAKGACFLNSGYMAVYDGELNRARTLFAEALALARELLHNTYLAWSLMGFASIAAAEKEARQAVQLLAIVQAMLKEADRRAISPADEAEYERHLAVARAQMDKAGFCAAWEEGRWMTIEQAITKAEQIAIGPQESTATATERSPHPAGLTDREVEVLHWLARGLSNQEIADRLVLSKRTVHAHLRSIYSKLDVTTRSAATRAAIDSRIV